MVIAEATKAFADGDDFAYVSKSCAVARISVRKESKFLFASLVVSLFNLHLVSMDARIFNNLCSNVEYGSTKLPFNFLRKSEI